METRKIMAILVLALGLMVWPVEVSAAEPMGTAFTYQGLLYDANYVANGLYDFAFKLYDANVGGSKAGTDVNVADVDVIDGYFTVELDFGDVYDGNERWLEIGVRPGEMNDPNAYTALSPRQEVTPTPYALYAETAGGDNDWMVSGNDMYSIPSGSVGIGTTNPRTDLEIKGTTGLRVTTGQHSNVFGEFKHAYSDGLLINANAGGGWADMSLQTDNTTRLFIESGGNVGIGTTDPSQKLNVVGDANITGSLYAGSGSTVLFVDDVTNKVGIGTTNPGARLQVGDTDVGHDVYIAGSTNSQSGLFFYDGSIPGGMRYNFSTDDLSIFTAGSTRVMIDSAGDVGIGTTSPEAKLHSVSTDMTKPGVYGENKSTGYGVYGKSAFTGVHGEGQRGIYAKSDTMFGIFSDAPKNYFSDNVGIGTMSPSGSLYPNSKTLEVEGIAPSIVLDDTDGTIQDDFEISNGGDKVLFRDATDNVVLLTLGLSGTIAGNVGIGTTSPEAKLHVKQSLDLEIARFETEVGTKVVINRNGNVGIGMTGPWARLQLPNADCWLGCALARDWQTYSSIRWKENISEINSDEALAKIMQLKPVHFKWKEEYGNNSDTGFIAEDVGEVIPEAVEWNGEHAEGLSTAQIIAYLTKVVQSQQEEIEKQWEEIEALKSKLNTGQ